MCGYNNSDINDFELLDGINRYGVDNPLQIVTRRFALYGNDDGAHELL